MTGADIIADVFIKNQIERVYLFPGGTIMPLLHASVARGLSYFCARHEQGAGYAALALARLTRKPQVVMVTSGPGATNLVTTVADAYFDSTPLVVVTGQVGRSDMRLTKPVRQGGFQETDTINIMKPITKAAFLADDPQALREVFQRAFYLAAEGRYGPVLVDLPMDVQRALVEEELPVSEPLHPPLNIQPDKETLDTLAAWISNAERPVLLLGQGVILSGATEAVRELARKYQIPVVMTLLGLSAFPTTDNLSMNFLGHTGTRYANLAVHNADLLIALGARLDVRQTGTETTKFVPQGKVVRVDIDAAEIQYSRVKCDLPIKADCKDALNYLLAKLQGRSVKTHTAWLNRCNEWKKDYSITFKSNGDMIYPQHVIEKISQYVGDKKCIVVTGVGSHQQWVARHFHLDYPKRRWLTSGGHGAMGYDLPSAMGAKLAFPDEEVLCFVGDGSFQMNIQELASLVEYNIPLKIIVLDNQRLGLVSQFQNLNWNNDYSTGNKWNPPFADIARAFGIKGYSISSAEKLDGMITAFMEEKGPALLHCHVSVHEDVTPMLLAGQTMDDMWPPI